MDAKSALLLIPTQRELDVVREFLPDDFLIESCGFGPIAAGIETARLWCGESRGKVQNVILLGIGGTSDPAALPIGSAASFQTVWCDEIGAGSGDGFLGPRELGIPQLQWDPDQICFDHLPLVPLDFGTVAEGLLTVTAASPTLEQARQRFARFPECLCEDMEGFAVALAGRRVGASVSVVRGISNITGDREYANWKVRPALEAAANLVCQVLS